MKIVSAATAFPAHYYSQEVLLAALTQYWDGKLEDPRILARLHTRAGVDGRHLALPLLEYYDLKPGATTTAPGLRPRKNWAACPSAAPPPPSASTAQHIRALLFMSITGVSSPSIDARMINRLGLSPQIRRLPVFGLGCVGGAAGISRAAD